MKRRTILAHRSAVRDDSSEKVRESKKSQRLVAANHRVQSDAIEHGAKKDETDLIDINEQ